MVYRPWKPGTTCETFPRDRQFDSETWSEVDVPISVE